MPPASWSTSSISISWGPWSFGGGAGDRGEGGLVSRLVLAPLRQEAVRGLTVSCEVEPRVGADDALEVCADGGVWAVPDLSSRPDRPWTASAVRPSGRPPTPAATVAVWLSNGCPCRPTAGGHGSPRQTRRHAQRAVGPTVPGSGRPLPAAPPVGVGLGRAPRGLGSRLVVMPSRQVSQQAECTRLGRFRTDRRRMPSPSQMAYES